MSRGPVVESNLIGYGSAGVSVKSGRVLDVEVHGDLAEAQEIVSNLEEKQGELNEKRIRWAVVKIVETL